MRPCRWAKSNDWNVTLVGRLGTGLPYTPQILTQTVYLVTNSGRKPSQVRVDLLADKTFAVYGMRLTGFLKVYNLFDSLIERYVYDDTGRATYTLVATQGTAAGNQCNSRGEFRVCIRPASIFNVPTYYAPPREVRIGFNVEL